MEWEPEVPSLSDCIEFLTSITSATEWEPEVPSLSDCTEFLTNISDPVVSLSCSIKDKLGAAASNCNRLISETKTLFARRNDTEAAAERDNEKKVTAECQRWISSVNEFENEVLELEAKYNKEKHEGRNKIGCFPRSKHSLSKLLLGKFKKGSPGPVRYMLAPKTEDTPSLHCATKAILGLLRDRNISRIGLWGMVGIGKTIIMKNLNNNRDVAKMFDIIIYVKVPKEGCKKLLHGAIAQRLKLNVEGIIHPDELARRIYWELECKRYLLLLDEVDYSLDLQAIGIPNNQKDSKVVLATRRRRICFDMETDEQIKVKYLSEADACKMFREKVGKNINTPRIEDIAKTVAGKCCGLPLIIDRVAKAFRPKDSFELWNDGLRNLKSLFSTRGQGIDELIEFLKSYYKDLDCEDKRFCLLYTTFYPEDSKMGIDYLLECLTAEGFIYDANQNRVTPEKSHKILHDLTDVSLESIDSKALIRTPEEQQRSASEEEGQQAN